MTQNALRRAFKLILARETKPKSLRPNFSAQLLFESHSKTITQKGNAHLGLGQFDEARECYESLRTLGENSTSDEYLEKLNEAQERERHLFQ